MLVLLAASVVDAEIDTAVVVRLVSIAASATIVIGFEAVHYQTSRPRLSSCLPVIPNGLDKQWKHKSVDNCSYDTKSSDNVPNWPSLISSKALAACSLLCPRSMIVDSVSAWWAPEATLEQLEHISGFGGMIESHCGQDG